MRRISLQLEQIAYRRHQFNYTDDAEPGLVRNSVSDGASDQGMLSVFEWIGYKSNDGVPEEQQLGIKCAVGGYDFSRSEGHWVQCGLFCREQLGYGDDHGIFRGRD